MKPQWVANPQLPQRLGDAIGCCLVGTIGLAFVTLSLLAIRVGWERGWPYGWAIFPGAILGILAGLAFLGVALGIGRGSY